MEGQITAGLHSGDDAEEGFAGIFRTYYKPVLRFFEKRGFSNQESQDLTQETFIRVFRGIEGFRGDAPFESWLFQVAANNYRNALRSRGAAKRAGDHVAISDAAEDTIAAVEVADTASKGPLAMVLEDEKTKVLSDAVNCLPAQMRRCVTLRVYQDLSYQEIATLMRLSIETVKAHLYQARKQLRIKLSPYFEQVEF